MRKVGYTYWDYFKTALLVACLILPATIRAQQIAVHAPRRVSAGENFQIAYTVNTQNVESFRAGNIPQGLEVIAGPYTSSQSSFQIQMVNGHTSSSSSITYTYTLYASKDGSYTIPPAHATVAGRRIASQSLKINVTGQAQAQGRRPNMHQEDEDEPRMRSAGSAITAKDLFIRVTANKQRVHEQEPVLLTYKVYTLVDLTQLEGKMPDLKGFHTQEVPLPQQKTFHTERVGGRAYKCVTWSQYVMYPQMTGKLEIPSITFKGIVVQENRNVDPFEAFFNGGSGYVEVKRNIQAPGITIQVDPLPQRPANFSGGVGRFNISASLSKQEVKAGEPITLRVVVGGVGNLKLLKQPVANFPKDFDKYDAKVTDKTRLTANGVEGNMIYDFLVVPRNQGKYTLPPVSFVYYDVNENRYKTIRTQSFELTVNKGDGSQNESYDGRTSEDIRPLKTGKIAPQKDGDFFFGSMSYWTTLTILLAIFIALMVAFRRRAIERADVVRLRSNKANKVATRRLKKAGQLMLKGRTSEFYDEVLRALWGYVGDKLNMPVMSLSRENIQEKLAQHHVDEKTIGKFVSALDECEFERYAPGDEQGNMSRTFERAMTAIMEIEDVMKMNKKRHHSLTTVLLLLLFVVGATPAQAITKQNADTEYAKGNYQQAIKDYQELLKGATSAALYYNLGNAYYRTDNITQAVLAYERAHLLSPGDKDISFNLQLARSKTIDKITPKSEMIFVTAYKALVNFTSVDHWACAGMVVLMVALILFLVYLFSPLVTWRKIGFFGAAFLLLVFLFCNLFAWQQKDAIENRTGAIVTAPSVSVRRTPSKNSNEEFVIHEGTRINITDDSMRQWRGVELDDGREGWVPTNAIEEI